MSCRALFADFTLTHDDHVIGHLADDFQIVTDEQHGHAMATLQLVEQFEDLLLYRHVECCGRFIGNQQSGFTGDGHGNHDALLLAARQLERIGARFVAWFRQTHFMQQFDRACPGRLPAQAQVQTQHFTDLAADAEHRIERAHRLLENHRDFTTAQLAHGFLWQLQQIVFAIEDAAAGIDDGVLWRQQTEDGQ